MEIQNTDLIGGSLQISTEVIAKIARCAALEIEGVKDIASIRQSKAVKNLLENMNLHNPVAVEMKDGIAEITISMIVAYGTRIPSVAEKVQENVKASVQNMTSVAVSRVNLVIAGLALENGSEEEA